MLGPPNPVKALHGFFTVQFKRLRRQNKHKIIDFIGIRQFFGHFAMRRPVQYFKANRIIRIRQHQKIKSPVARRNAFERFKHHALFGNNAHHGLVVQSGQAPQFQKRGVLQNSVHQSVIGNNAPSFTASKKTFLASAF